MRPYRWCSIDGGLDDRAGPASPATADARLSAPRRIGWVTNRRDRSSASATSRPCWTSGPPTSTASSGLRSVSAAVDMTGRMPSPNAPSTPGCPAGLLRRELRAGRRRTARPPGFKPPLRAAVRIAMTLLLLPAVVLLAILPGRSRARQDVLPDGVALPGRARITVSGGPITTSACCWWSAGTRDKLGRHLRHRRGAAGSFVARADLIRWPAVVPARIMKVSSPSAGQPAGCRCGRHRRRPAAGRSRRSWPSGGARRVVRASGLRRFRPAIFRPPSTPAARCSRCGWTTTIGGGAVDGGRSVGGDTCVSVRRRAGAADRRARRGGLALRCAAPTGGTWPPAARRRCARITHPVPAHRTAAVGACQRRRRAEMVRGQPNSEPCWASPIPSSRRR